MQCLCQTPLQSRHKSIPVKVLPNEDHFALVMLSLLPHLSWFSLKHFMHTLQSI